MATSRLYSTTNLSPSIYDYRQVQARIRALQQRTNALYEELIRSSSNADTAVGEIERAYAKITNEFQEQRDQLLRRLHHVKVDIKESTAELKEVRKGLNTAQSFHLPKYSPRHSVDLEAREISAMVDDTERLLNKIVQKLKEIRFISSNGPVVGKRLGRISVKNVTREGTALETSRSFVNEYVPPRNVYVYKLYTVDIDISAKWVISSIDKRIFLCDTEGEVRIFSYSRSLRRQPLLTERFHLSNIRLISSFTVTQDYLIAFETDTQILTLHTHHGALLIRLYFPYQPTIMTRCECRKKNQIWICSRTKRQCYQFSLNHMKKQVNVLDEIDFTTPISNILIDPVGISCDEQDRIAVHDVNMTTMDRLILFMNKKNTIVPLDFIKYHDKLLSSCIEYILLVPKRPDLLVLVYAPQSTVASLREIVIADIHSKPPRILNCFSEVNGVESIDVTPNSELVYTVTIPAHKRMPPKMHIYSLTN